MTMERTIRTLLARTPCRVIGGNNWEQKVHILTSDGLRLWVDIDHLNVQGYVVGKAYDADDNARREHLRGLVRRARLGLSGEGADVEN